MAYGSVNNYFHFIGRVYGNPLITKSSIKRQTITRFTIVVEDGINKHKSYLPCIALGKVADKCALFCTNGNTIAVEGGVHTEDRLHKEEGQEDKHRVAIQFLVVDVILINKVAKHKFKSVNDVKNLIAVFDPDDYVLSTILDKDIEEEIEDEQ